MSPSAENAPLSLGPNLRAMDRMISLRPFLHKEVLIPRAPGEWTPICLSAGPSAYLFSFWHAPRHESQKVQGKFTALSIFNIYGEVTSARLPDLAEPSGWTVGQALHLSDIMSFPHGHRCNLWAPQRAWALWRVACFSSIGVLAGAGGTSPHGPSPGPGSSRAGACDLFLGPGTGGLQLF